MHTTDFIDWESPQSHVLLNPRMPQHERRAITDALESTDPLPGHIWLTTSGSSGTLKLAALSKRAVLVSAAAVNRHLQCQSSDIWINPLPLFHVGGLAIKARSYLTGGKLVEPKFSGKHWNPHQFIEQTVAAKATLTALVPAQIFDLVQAEIAAPSSLRATIIGGGPLSEMVYEKALELGWKLLPSYGSTECSSQIATAPLFSWDQGCIPMLKPLDHLKIALNQEGILQVCGDSLLTCYAFPNTSTGLCRFEDPKVNGWFVTEDIAVLENGALRSITRKGYFVKIGGESVDLLRLDKILDEVRLSLKISDDMSIFAAPHERLGHVIHLAIAAKKNENIDLLLKNFHERVHPYERIREVHYVESIPRTFLKKVIRPQKIR